LRQTLLTVLSAALALAALNEGNAAPPAYEKDFTKPTPEEALAWLKSLPRVWRSAQGKKILVQLWEDYTVEDLKTVRLIHPGGHIEDPDAPDRFSRGHLRLKPEDWRYFTVFESLETFEMGHDLEGVTDQCIFYLGQLPQSMRTIKLEMSEATGEGVKHLQNLKKLTYLSLNFSRTITDVALVHAGEIDSLETINVHACPNITGSGVAALAELKHLKVLKIGSCSLSNASLRHFKNLAVEELDLSHVEQGWIVRYRGGGKAKFTVTASGLRQLLRSRRNLPNLKRLLLANTQFTSKEKRALAKLRPGLVVK
jgi:hypothetical protein